MGLSSFDVALRLRSQLWNSNALSLTWVRSPQALFQLEASPDLNPGHWVPLTNAPTFDGLKFRVTVSAPQGSIFYRLRQFHQPF